MVNPISNVYQFFLQIFQALPLPIVAFVMLAFALFVIVAIINMIFR